MAIIKQPESTSLKIKYSPIELDIGDSNIFVGWNYDINGGNVSLFILSISNSMKLIQVV